MTVIKFFTMRYFESVANLCGIPLEQTVELSQQELVDKYILPSVVGKAETRNGISDVYMQFMTEWGGLCFVYDRSSGIVLLELGLQRISNGAVGLGNDPWNYELYLPEKYRQYAIHGEAPQKMSAACYAFLEANLEFCMNIDELSDHAETIVFELLDNLNAKGQELNGYDFNAKENKINPADAYNFAWDIAVKELSTVELYNHFATPERWQHYKSFFHSYVRHLNWSDFFKRIKMNGIRNIRNRYLIRKEIENGNFLE